MTAVSCADSKYPTDEASWAELDKKYRAVSPFDSYGEFTGHAPRGTCAFWPVASDVAAHPVQARDLPPVLVISTTGDPATPYLDGVHLAEQLRGTLLTVDGTQHTAAFDVECVDDIVAAYLVDLTLPPPDTRCSSGH